MAFIGPLVGLAIMIVVIAGLWKAFVKAGQPGWGCLVPIYNIYLMMLIAGKPGWWLILCFIPVVNIVVGIIALIAIAEKFGKGTGFAIGLLLLGVIFWPILGFGSAQYSGGAAPAAPAAPAE
jgi:uncharacterized protein DUF5684